MVLTRAIDIQTTTNNQTKEKTWTKIRLIGFRGTICHCGSWCHPVMAASWIPYEVGPKKNRNTIEVLRTPSRLVDQATLSYGWASEILHHQFGIVETCWNPINNGITHPSINWWLGFRWPIHSIISSSGMGIEPDPGPRNRRPARLCRPRCYHSWLGRGVAAPEAIGNPFVFAREHGEVSHPSMFP